MKGENFMRKIVLFLALIMITTTVYSQEQMNNFNGDKNTNFYKHSLGGAGGFVTGYGLSYRRWFNPKNGLQIAFAPYIDNNSIITSIGITYLKKFIDSKITGLFLYAGYHNWYKQNNSALTEYRIDEKGNQTPVILPAPQISVNNNFGVGPGFELKIDEHIVINLMFGYAIYINHNNSPYDKNDGVALLFTGECGIFYNF